MTGDEREELNRLLAENRRLRESLAEHGIAWQPRDPATTTERLARLGTDEKVKLVASLFRGRQDVYPIRWGSKAGKSGCGLADFPVVVEHARQGCDFTATFDRGMRKLPGVKIL